MITIKDSLIYAMDGANPPAARISSGDTVCFETRDCFNCQLDRENTTVGKMDWDHVNPATGPLFVEGAHPGSILQVEILDIVPGPAGVMCALPENGVLGDIVTSESVRILDIIDGKVIFSDEIILDCDPMIGVIGVAPRSGSVNCGTPDSHGGNMDNTRIRKGSTLYLPVFREGALLALGDVHAVMGDGEIMVTGVETNATVTLRVSVLNGSATDTPLLMDKDFCYVISSDEDVEKAIYDATLTMNKILQARLGLSLNEAGMLMSAAGHVKICQVVDPKRTVTFAMPRKILPSLF
jgi:amidase